MNLLSFLLRTLFSAVPSLHFVVLVVPKGTKLGMYIIILWYS